MAYNHRTEAYADNNEFHYLNRSPQPSIPAFQKQGEISATAVQHSNYFGAEEPLNTSQPQFTPPRPKRSCFSVLGSWVWELLSCLLALGALVGIFVVLKRFDGRALKDWPYSITINTLLSVLVTVIKAAIVVPLAEGISQLKWTWYKKRDHALGDVALYDVASRGIFGALKFVLSKNPFHLATVASILFIASFAIGPFAQQVVQFDQRNILSGEKASVPVCGGPYKDYTTTGASGVFSPGLPTIGAIYDGFYQNNSNTLVDTTCQTGNCTFPTYQSLGFCSRCADISNELVSYNPKTGAETSYEDCPESSGCTYDLRQGKLRIGGQGSGRYYVNTTSAAALLHPDLVDIPGVVNITALYGARNREGSITARAAAYECALYYCVLQYDGKVTGGNFTEIPTEIPSKAEVLGQLWAIGNVTLTPETCSTGGSIKTPPYDDKDNCTYFLDGFDGRALTLTITPLFVGIGFADWRPTWIPTSIQKLWHPTENRIEAIDSVFKSLAKRLTNHVRTMPDICKSTVAGKVFANEVYISVRWLWIIFPAAVVVATFVLLIAIIVRTWDDYIWKSSPLALVFLGMQDQRQSDGVTHPVFPVNPEIKSMEDSSWDIKMRLNRSGRWDIIGNR